jgi:hypothetical protein
VGQKSQNSEKETEDCGFGHLEKLKKCFASYCQALLGKFSERLDDTDKTNSSQHHSRAAHDHFSVSFDPLRFSFLEL